MSSAKIVLILGAGGNIGASIARLFAKRNYQVALASRSAQDSTSSDGYLNIRTDVADATSINSAFDKVTTAFGPPNVVVYNAASVQAVPAEDPLSLSIASFNQDIAVNTAGLLVAAKRAVQSFQQLPPKTPATFIYTGNILNQDVIPPLISLGIGKSASAHLIAVASKVYASAGYRFYYADERKENGDAAFHDISGDLNARYFLELAETEEQRPWLQTFVGGQGYKAFPASFAGGQTN